VRVMTVHAAKGLEAPIVFLADACAVAYAGKTERLLDLGDRDSGRPLFVWAARKAEDPAQLAAARERARAAAAGEHRRLLYVAMTRAAQRLIVVGHHGVRGPAEDNWHELVRSGLAGELRDAPAPWAATETVWRMGEPSRETTRGEIAPPAAMPAEPLWLREDAAPEASDANLAPSRAAARQARPGGDRRAGRRAGALAHALLQRLPDVAPDRRRAFADSFFSAQGEGLDAATRSSLVEAALAVLALPSLAPLFAEGSRAEVAIAAAIDRKHLPPLRFVGRIDRLAVADDAALVADFKHGARPPGPIPRAYVAQLALYRAALAPLFPDRPIRALIVWLSGAEAVEIAPAELEAALASLAESR